MSGPLGSSQFMYSAGAGDFYGYQIANSVFFDGTSSYLTKTWGQAASNDDKYAVSFWFKRNGESDTNSALGSTTNTKIFSADTYSSNSNIEQIEINTGNPSGFSDQIGFGGFPSGSGYSAWYKPKLRDPTAWYHYVQIYDSTNATANYRILVYLNGINLPTDDSDLWNYTNSNLNPYPASGDDTLFGKNGQENAIGRYTYNDASYWGGSMAEFIFIDGAASISDFGEFKNTIWIPKDPSGLTFGNNGFHLKFTNASDFGEDFSGNDNDFTANNLSASAQSIDTPTFGT